MAGLERPLEPPDARKRESAPLVADLEAWLRDRRPGGPLKTSHGWAASDAVYAAWRKLIV